MADNTNNTPRELDPVDAILLEDYDRAIRSARLEAERLIAHYESCKQQILAKYASATE